MGQTIQLHASDGVSISAYKATPAATPKGGVVVIQEIFGLNSHVREVADWYASQGYIAVAPAMFDRVQPGVDLGYTPDDIQAGMGIARGKVDMAAAVLDLEAAAAEAATGGKVGVVGYCWGGALTALSAIKLGGKVHACSSYYGGGTAAMIGDSPVVPMIMHFGEHDHAIPLTDVDKIKAAWPAATVYIYEGAEHGFNCDQRASFHEPSRDLARQRTLDFFAAQLAS